MLFIAIMATGTAGYLFIGGPNASVINAFYMTFITIATIGYGEVIDLTHSPGGRLFTVGISIAGIINFTYILSSLTAFIVESDFNETMRRRRMEKTIDRTSGHYIVCGLGRVGENVARELAACGQSYVAVDLDREKIDLYHESVPDALCLAGDASEDALLLKAGLARAAGVFAITGDDSKNLVITLSAKQLNPGTRVVARCHDVHYVDKIRRVGADAIVSPDFTGGMRLVSSMLRPRVVSFLDEMLRGDEALRIEEVAVPDRLAGETLDRLALRSPEYVFLAVLDANGWRFNPQPDFILTAGQTLIVMATSQGRHSLERQLASLEPSARRA